MVFMMNVKWITNSLHFEVNFCLYEGKCKLHAENLNVLKKSAHKSLYGDMHRMISIKNNGKHFSFL